MKVSMTNIRKRNLRANKFKLKKKISNSLNESWYIIESLTYKLRLYKYPKHKITRPLKYVSKKRVPIAVPRIIDYYNSYNFSIVNKFLRDIKDCVLISERQVFLNFASTEKISASAMLSFLAEVEIIINTSDHGRNAISFNHPKSPKIESILKQVGFYDLLNKNKRDTESFEDVTFWKYTSGKCSEPMLAKPMLIEIKKELEQKASKKLYRGFIEAMSNSVEHAYGFSLDDCEARNTAKWWTFAGIRNSQLVVVLCDKGVGIPKTLPKTQGPGFLAQLLANIGYKKGLVTDATYIKAATNLNNTSTGKKHRGKGLTDIKSVIDTIGAGSLLIISNKGQYNYRANGNIKGVIQDHTTSVNGTIVEWSIPLKMVDK